MRAKAPASGRNGTWKGPPELRRSSTGLFREEEGRASLARPFLFGHSGKERHKAHGENYRPRARNFPAFPEACRKSAWLFILTLKVRAKIVTVIGWEPGSRTGAFLVRPSTRGPVSGDGRESKVERELTRPATPDGPAGAGRCKVYHIPRNTTAGPIPIQGQNHAVLTAWVNALVRLPPCAKRDTHTRPLLPRRSSAPSR